VSINPKAHRYAGQDEKQLERRTIRYSTLIGKEFFFYMNINGGMMRQVNLNEEGRVSNHNSHPGQKVMVLDPIL
jgi:hypothetical protein